LARPAASRASWTRTASIASKRVSATVARILNVETGDYADNVAVNALKQIEARIAAWNDAGLTAPLAQAGWAGPSEREVQLFPAAVEGNDDGKFRIPESVRRDGHVGGSGHDQPAIIRSFLQAGR
jgi:hypothetical protein